MAEIAGLGTAFPLTLTPECIARFVSDSQASFRSVYSMNKNVHSFVPRISLIREMVAHRAESDNYYVLVISFSPQTDLNSPASLKRRSRTFATGAPLDTCYAIFLKTHAKINGHAEIFQTRKFSSTIFESNASISRNSQTLRNQLTPNVVGQHEVGDRLAISKLTSIADLNRTLVSIRSIVKWHTSAGLRAEAWLNSGNTP